MQRYFTSAETAKINFSDAGIAAYWCHVEAKGFRIKAFADTRDAALVFVENRLAEIAAKPPADSVQQISSDV